MKTLRKIVVLLVVAMMLSISSLAASPASESSKSTDSFEGMTVTWETSSSGEITEDMLAYYEPITEKTGIKLEIGSVDSQTLPITIAGGAGPDIAYLNGPSEMMEYVRAGKAVDLTEYAKKYGWDDKFYEWAYDACKYDGKIYALPTAFEGMGLFYNMDLMQANGWTIPTNLEDFEALCEKIKKAGYVPIAFANQDSKSKIQRVVSSMFSCYCDGVKNIKACLEGKQKWTENKGVRHAVETMLSWFEKGYIEPNHAAITGGEARKRFGRGECVIYFSGTWDSAALNHYFPDLNWKFELMPAQKKGGDQIFPVATGGAIMINANSKKQDAAAEVLNAYFFENVENTYEGIISGAEQPLCVKWTDASKLTGMAENLAEMDDVLFKSMNEGNIGYCVWTFYSSEVASAITDLTDSLIFGEITIDQYLGALQKAMDKDIADNAVPSIP